MSTMAQALDEAKKLKAVANKYGITTSIELQAGRGEPLVRKYCVMNHHTASHKPAPGKSTTPLLALCKEGRSDVPGPLCNGYGGYDFVFRIITMGLANHPGQGGPITIDGVHIPLNSARGPTFGIEWEGGYHTWTNAERIWMATVNVAIQEYLDRPVTSQLEHKTWAPTRKIDRKDYTRDMAIADARQVTPGQGGGEEVVTPEQMAELKKEIRNANRTLAHYLTSGSTNSHFKPDESTMDYAWMSKSEHVTLNELTNDEPGFLAVPEDWADGDSVFYVASDFQSKVQFTDDGPLHDLIRFFLVQSGGSTTALRRPQAELDEIPTVTV